MVFEVSGVDLTPYIAQGGLKWKKNDIDGPNAGRLTNGDMRRDRIATKIRWDVTCRPLTIAELAVVSGALDSEYVSVTYTNPRTAAVQSGIFYAGDLSAELMGVVRDGVEYWAGLTFPLIQQ